MKPSARVQRSKPSKPLIGVELGKRMVDDPYEKGAKLEVVVNLRENPLDHWNDRGQIDGAMYLAGCLFRLAWERGEVGSVAAMDPAKPFVDGGKLPEPVSDGRWHDPFRNKWTTTPLVMGEAQLACGMYNFSLVQRVLGERIFPRELAQGDESLAREFGSRVRYALRDMARSWGMYPRPSAVPLTDCAVK